MQDQPKSSSTRSQVLLLLKTEGMLSVGELASRLGITEMAIRRHLGMLERDGLIESTLIRKAMGRPMNRYTLTELAEETFPRNYHQLTLELLQELVQEDGKERILELFERRQDRLQVKYQSRMQGKSMSERVAELAEIQNNSGYMADWDQPDDQHYVINEYNCPISQVANTYQQACNCELALFKNLLGTSHIERTECLAKGGRKCSYQIKS